MSIKIHNVPNELKQYNNWIVWRYELRPGAPVTEKPTKVPYSPFDGKKCDVTDTSRLGTFQNAISAQIFQRFDGVGFVFNNQVPYSGIDLDDPMQIVDGKYKFANPQDQAEFQKAIFEQFNSYAEKSPSGKGLHIIVRGKMVKSGARRDSVEVYSTGRYFTMTGDVYRNAPIVDYENELMALETKLTPKKDYKYSGQSLERIHTNNDIIERAQNASNGDLFVDLYNGHWENKYSSQSEADFALIDIIAYYTDNSLQVIEIFKTSKLAQRDKANRDDYVSNMVNRAFDNKPNPIDFSDLMTRIEKLQRSSALQAPVLDNASPATSTGAPTNDNDQVHFRSQWPTGMLGHIVKYLYDQSPRPVYEIALMAGLSFLSGITGRAYNVSGSGLNNYYLVLASSGMGKEAAASGIDKIVDAVVNDGVGAIKKFIGPADMGSGQGLLRHLSEETQCCVSIVGEFGLRLKVITQDRASTPDKQLVRVLLALYSKSGQGNTVRSTVYSDTSKNTKDILSPAFTLFGESTPSTLLPAINEETISNGLIPRFVVLEYKGARPKYNTGHSDVTVPNYITGWLKKLITLTSDFNNQNKAVSVPCNDDAKQELDKYNDYCDNIYNKSNNEIAKVFYSRSHLKVWKIAGLLAVSDNFENPIITVTHVQWAISLVNEATEIIVTRFERGELGIEADDQNRVDTMIEAIKDFINYENIKDSDLRGFNYRNSHLHKPLRRKGIIPISYLNRRLNRNKAFKEHKLGSNRAIELTAKMLIDAGYIQPVNKKQAQDEHNVKCLVYAINDDDLFA